MINGESLHEYNARVAHHDGRHTHCRASACAEVATWWWLDNDMTPAQWLESVEKVTQK